MQKIKEAIHEKESEPCEQAHVGYAAVRPLTSCAHPFHGEPRITLSPHVGGVTADAYVKMGVAAVRNALAVMQR